MMINGATEIATIVLRHEFAELCRFGAQTKPARKVKRAHCGRYLSLKIYCSVFMDSWAACVSTAQPLQFHLQASQIESKAISGAFRKLHCFYKRS